jgi:hypothetical protein
VSATVSVSKDDFFDGRGRAEGKRTNLPRALPQASGYQRPEKVDAMEKEMDGSGKMYFEDLPKHVQDLLLDLIVSIVALGTPKPKNPVSFPIQSLAPIAGSEKAYQGKSENHLGKLAVVGAKVPA